MKWPEFDKFDIEKHTHLLAHVGSHSHGTYIPPTDGGIDDIDVMGLVIPPKEFYLGLSNFEHLCTWVEEYDLVFYDIKKFFSLLLKNNPNVMGLLWLEPHLYLKNTPVTDLLIENREIFSSKRAHTSFTGYAYSQLKKMENHACEGYMGDKRKKLVEKFGYDTKNAAHLIRLLRMGNEFLVDGKMNVMRKDARELVMIKRGDYSLSEIKKMADELFSESHKNLERSSLPDNPDFEKAEKLLVEIIQSNI
jgi:predicted nucleotidyltransferase